MKNLCILLLAFLPLLILFNGENWLGNWLFTVCVVVLGYILGRQPWRE